MGQHCACEWVLTMMRWVKRAKLCLWELHLRGGGHSAKVRIRPPSVGCGAGAPRHVGVTSDKLHICC